LHPARRLDANNISGKLISNEILLKGLAPPRRITEHEVVISESLSHK
jgi:hypothetical protein